MRMELLQLRKRGKRGVAKMTEEWKKALRWMRTKLNVRAKTFALVVFLNISTNFLVKVKKRV